MKTIETDDANMTLAEVARKISEPFVVTDHGKPVAVLLPLEDADLETVSLNSNPRFLEIIDRSLSA